VIVIRFIDEAVAQEQREIGPGLFRELERFGRAGEDFFLAIYRRGGANGIGFARFADTAF